MADDRVRGGAEMIANERARQMLEEGWTAEHDDEHYRGEMLRGALCYANNALWRVTLADVKHGGVPPQWPWDFQWWKPGVDAVGDLVKAGALIAAEIDRLQRAAI